MNKKICAALLVISMIFSSGLQVFAWESAADDANDFAKELINALNIMKIDEKGGFDEHKAVTRGELAEIIVNLANASGAKSYTQYFTDVNNDNEYASSISILAAMKIVSGTGNSEFKPEQNATYEQAIKMIVYTLGYKQVAEQSANSMSECIRIASELNITKGISAKNTDTLTKGIILNLCYNALDSEVLIQKNRGYERGDTLLKEKFKIDKLKGIISTNYKTSLNSSEVTASKEYIKINGDYYKDVTNSAADMLGMQVQIYYREENGDNVIVAIFATNQNQIIEIESQNLCSDSKQYDYNTVIYTNETNKEQKIKLDSNADIIYNGRAYLDFTLDLLKPSTGKMRFIDNNKDGKADVVLITEYDNYVVKSISEETVYDKYGKYLSLKDADIIEIEGMYGSSMNIGQIVEWNVLSVAKSKDGKVIKIISLNDPVIGPIQSINSSDNRIKITIDGDVFMVADSYLKALSDKEPESKEFEVGRRGTFYLDKDEKIAAVLYDDANEWQYGFLFNAVVDENTEESFFKIMSDHTGAKNYDGADKIKIDGIICKNVEKIKENLGIADEKFEPKLIKFSMDGEGKISGIDTDRRTSKETEDTLIKAADKEEQYWSIRTGRFGNGETTGIQMDMNRTLVFQAPKTDIYDYDKYIIRTKNYQNNDKLLFDAYDTDSTGLAKCVVIYNDSSNSEPEYDRLILVSDTMIIYDDESGENLQMIRGYDTSGNVVEFVSDESEPQAEISDGDIITFNLNYKNRMENILIRFDRDDEYTISKRVFNNTGDYVADFTANAQDYMIKTVIGRKTGKNIMALAPEIDFSSMLPELNYFNTQNYNLSDAKIFCINARGRINLLAENKVDDYVYPINTSARVVLYSTYTQLRTVYIYE